MFSVVKTGLLAPSTASLTKGNVAGPQVLCMCNAVLPYTSTVTPPFSTTQLIPMEVRGVSQRIVSTVGMLVTLDL